MHLTPGRLHASAVCLAGEGILLLGASGAGKSTLALHLMALGADLIADDRVVLAPGPAGPVLAKPSEAPGLIEARGVGLLKADCVPEALLSLVVDMDRIETKRLPPLRWAHCGGFDVPLLHNVANGSFPAMVRQYVLHGRQDPDG